MQYDRVPLSPVGSPASLSSPSPRLAPPSRFSGGDSSGGLPSPATAKSCMSAAAKRYKYLRRLFHFRQMDFEFAFWQMVYLMSAPQHVYRNFQYRKQTKLQFARDDPAFLVLLAGWLVVSSAGFALVLNIGLGEFVKFLLYVIFVDCIGVGLVVATLLWLLSNKYLLKPAYRELDVEWGFAFDVHLNAFFPLLVILHFIQLFFYHLIIGRDLWVATCFGNTLWLIALGYYVYITFLGYNSLNILQRTQVFLYPMVPLVLFYGMTLLTNWNLSQSLMFFYHYRVL
ncbi:hypothetical protein TCAL_00435 [Tigriopus californicus]|uniref:Protein unc-50 homolog n=1 Tax=Tigriopus californicus TaxID=6832 RepID=A0A553NE25_TIGCA|nr:protein unc-50 homolog [Tigriopus californicus]TRY63609.1 hypothetical protein TCAL_00435 [Tigriopus californicus]|eukprot:TCALIF_00435-PA protein Name:"Similar to UNC50 Protein unc-50 homolog (Bos taurus)" AED:0.00 eAED:0.00 QI:0/-1/0/1/-1/1/1/0/283